MNKNDHPLNGALRAIAAALNNQAVGLKSIKAALDNQAATVRYLADRHDQATSEIVASQERQSKILAKALERQGEVLSSALRYMADRFTKPS